MKQTRIVESTRFEVWSANGYPGWVGSEYETKGEAYRALAEQVEYEASNGFKPLDYIVVQVKTGREFDKNGEFVSAYTNTRVVYNTEQIKKFMKQGL